MNENIYFIAVIDYFTCSVLINKSDISKGKVTIKTEQSIVVLKVVGNSIITEVYDVSLRQHSSTYRF